MAESAADRQADAGALLEATARRFYEIDRALYHERLLPSVQHHHRVKTWDEATPEKREFTRALVRRLLVAGLVNPVDPGPPPLEGQLEIER